MAVLVPNLSSGGYDPYNFGIAETYSYVPIANDQGRPIYAKASYITNFSDLRVSLTAGNVDIGSVHLLDSNNGLYFSIADVGLTGLDAGKGAIRVLTQDLDSNIDDITIGDKTGKFASVNAATSALNVYTVNSISAVSVTNLHSVFDSVTANQNVANSLLNTLTASNATAANQTATNTLLNSVTSNQATQITLEKTLSANSVYGTLPTQPLYVASSQAYPNLVSFASGPQLDTNNRLKVVVPARSCWYISSVDKDGDLRIIESFTPGASSIFVQNLACVAMTPGTSSTGSAIRASRRRFKVLPGVSQEWLGTVNFDGQDIGTIKRVGTFTNYNGMFFELSGTDFNVVIRRRLVDGTLAEERVNQTNFNVDKLDGNGPSGQNWYTSLSGGLVSGTNRWSVAIPGDGTIYNASFTYSNNSLSALKPGTKGTITGVSPSGYNGAVYIAAVNTATSTLTASYVFDPGVLSNASTAKFITTPYHNAHSLWFEFNGGRTDKVNFGINGSTGPTYLHQFDFSNQLGLQYESAPALMDRKEVLNYSAMPYNPSMTIDGTTINVEAESELNPAFVAAYNTTPITLAVGKEQPIIGVGLRAGEPYQRSDMQVQQMNVIDTANLNTGGNAKITSSLVQWKLLLNPGLSGIPASTDIGKSSRQWAYTATTAITSQGIELMSGFATSNSPIDVKTSLNFLNLGSNINYTDADKVVLTAKLVAAGTDPSTIVGSINAIEAL